MKKEKSSWGLGIMGIIFVVFTLMFMIGFFRNVSVGDWIAKENYIENGELNKQEWWINMGLFLGVMGGFYVLIETATDLISYLPSKKKR